MPPYDGGYGDVASASSSTGSCGYLAISFAGSAAPAQSNNGRAEVSDTFSGPSNRDSVAGLSGSMVVVHNGFRATFCHDNFECLSELVQLSNLRT
jgi:hypothetical protein